MPQSAAPGPQPPQLAPRPLTISVSPPQPAAPAPAPYVPPVPQFKLETQLLLLGPQTQPECCENVDCCKKKVKARFPIFYQRVGLANIHCRNVTCEFVVCTDQDKTQYNLTLLNNTHRRYSYTMHVFVAVTMTIKSNHCLDLLGKMCQQQPDNYECEKVGVSNFENWFYYKPKSQVTSSRQNTLTIQQRNESGRELRPRKRQAERPAENTPNLSLARAPTRVPARVPEAREEPCCENDDCCKKKVKQRFPTFYTSNDVGDIECRNVTCLPFFCNKADETKVNVDLINDRFKSYTYTMHIFVSIRMTRSSNHCKALIKNICQKPPRNYTCTKVGKIGYETWFYYKPASEAASTRQNEQTVEALQTSGKRTRRLRLQGGEGGRGKTSLLRALSRFSGTTPEKLEAVWQDATRRGFIEDTHSVRQLTFLVASILRRNVALVHFVDYDDGKGSRVARMIQSVTYVTAPELQTGSSYSVLYGITTRNPQQSPENTPLTFKFLLDNDDGKVSFFSENQLEWLIDQYKGPKKRRVYVPPSLNANAPTSKTTLAQYAAFLSCRT